MTRSQGGGGYCDQVLGGVVTRSRGGGGVVTRYQWGEGVLWPGPGGGEGGRCCGLVPGSLPSPPPRLLTISRGEGGGHSASSW